MGIELNFEKSYSSFSSPFHNWEICDNMHLKISEIPHRLKHYFGVKISHVMRKPTFCIFENSGTDQLHSSCEADQDLCFRYMDSKIPLLPRSKISSP